MLTHEHKDRLWVEIGREPYTRKDGATVELIRWATPCCAEGCSESVEIRTPVTGWETSKAFGAKHCAAHKLTRDEVKARWAAAVKSGRGPK